MPCLLRPDFLTPQPLTHEHCHPHLHVGLAVGSALIPRRVVVVFHSDQGGGMALVIDPQQFTDRCCPNNVTNSGGSPEIDTSEPLARNDCYGHALCPPSPNDPVHLPGGRGER